MKKFNEMYVIGIDHGYGNMKTANCCFPTGVMKSDIRISLDENSIQNKILQQTDIIICTVNKGTIGK